MKLVLFSSDGRRERSIQVFGCDDSKARAHALGEQ
jgi:hypothetical protein